MKSLILLILALACASGNEDVIHKSLKSMSFGETKNVFVSMKGGNYKVIDEINSQEFASREDKIMALNEGVKANSALSQGPVLNYLESTTLSFESYPYSNEIYVKNVDSNTIKAMSKMQNVDDIREEEIFKITTPVGNEVFTKQGGKVEWGVADIKAPESWDLGYSGQGVTACIIDTGVNINHVDLKDGYLGTAASWLDPTPFAGTKTPTDNHGHGTHVAGSICGKNGMGVAPNAKWIACRGCTQANCPGSMLKTCLEWAACPYKQGDSSKTCDPTSTPYVVNNSWGGGRGNADYNKVIKALESLGIIPVFAAGNDGPDCETHGSPGDQPDLIGVAATNKNRVIAKFSSRGPAKGAPDRQKPDVAAPGEKIVSASHRNNNGRVEMSGTSMASPHVAGACALLSSYKKLSYQDALKYLSDTSETASSHSGQTCGKNKKDHEYPNHQLGAGIINVYNALNALMADNK